jgi:hypothetical protein
MLTGALTGPDYVTVPFEGIGGHPDLEHEYGHGQFADNYDSGDE